MSLPDAEEGNASLVQDRERVRAHSNPFLAFFRLWVWAEWTLVCYVGYVFARLFVYGKASKRHVAVRWSHRWFIGCLKFAGIQGRVHGEVPKSPVMLTPNHLGYLDILAVGAACGTLFVSKAEVASWPVIGFLFRQSEGVGVSRDRTRGVREANDEVAERLSQGITMCVFLEGTSSGGVEVMPFHASLLQPAIDADVPVVPTAIRWSSEDSDIDIAEDVAYWKDHRLVPHLWRVMGLRALSVDISFGEPVPTSGVERKSLAEIAHDGVAHLLEELRGTH